jgi:cyclase
MLRKRLITLLMFNQGILYRTKNFEPDYRYTANFIDAWSVDEIILLDITRPENKEKFFFIDVAKQFSKNCFVPVCMGGGVRSLEDIKLYLDMGADKVSINTAALENPRLIKDAAEKFGSQCIVVSIDVKKINGNYFVFGDCGRFQTSWAPDVYAKYLQDLGAGEILINSIDKDGSLEGYDNDLNLMVANKINIPLMVCGGAGKWKDFVDGFNVGCADGVVTSNIYHFTESSILSAKKYIANHGILIRV